MKYLLMAFLALSLLSGCDKEDRDSEATEEPKPKKVKKEKKEKSAWKEVVAEPAAEVSVERVRFKTIILDGEEVIVTSRNGPFPNDGQRYIFEDTLSKGWDSPQKDCGPTG